MTSVETKPEPARNRGLPKSRGKRILFRLLALSLVLVPIGLCEGLFALLGWGVPDEYDDPYVGFSEVHPLFVRNGDRYEIPKSRLTYFRPASFPAVKGPRTFRVFCLGGSTVQGRPYAVETAFSTWLALDLKAADPGRDWEVINCGGVSYASYRLAPIVKELLDYQPDLFILYTGHNEFLEDRTYTDVRATPAVVSGAHELLSHSRTYCVLRSAWIHQTRPNPVPKTQLPGEVDAVLDYQGGLDTYHRDDTWRNGIAAHFEHNLRRMIGMARRAGVPMLLVDPPCNLKDCPPFKSEASADLTSKQRAEFDALWKEAQLLGSKQLERQCELLEQALAIDDRHAGAHYYLAQCFELLEQFDKAKAEYIRARDEDICPLRITTPLAEAVRRVARDTGTPLVGIRELFEAHSPHGIPGKEMFIDHVHPTIDGHQRIADALLEEMARQSLVSPAADWMERRKPLFREQMASLDDVYFQRGKQRLDGLLRWAQGRALKIRPTAGRELLEPPQ